VARIRQLDILKRPGVAETIDWARAVAFLGADSLDGEIALDTLGSVVKDHDDLARVRESLAEVIGDA
jgi:hypothetical protein